MGEPSSSPSLRSQHSTRPRLSLHHLVASFTRRKDSSPQLQTMPSSTDTLSSTSSVSRRTSWLPRSQTLTALAPPDQAPPPRSRLPRSDTEPCFQGKENHPPQIRHHALLAPKPPPMPALTPLRQVVNSSPSPRSFSKDPTEEMGHSAYWTGRLMAVSDARLTARCGKGEEREVHQRAVLGRLYAECASEGAREGLRAYCVALKGEGWKVGWGEVVKAGREGGGLSEARRGGFMGRLLGRR